MKKIAVVLCGSGYKDGSEIRESVLTLLALSQQGAEFYCFSPNDYQHDTVNCLTGEVMNEKRHMVVEAARIARGEVKSLDELVARDFDGVIFPGGFGVAKNLCTFALKGAAATVRIDVQKVLNDFYCSKKPIGAICIAPALIALAFKGKGLNLTVGASGEAADEIKKLGQVNIISTAKDCVIDKTHRIVTTPAYMDEEASLADIFKGINGVVHAVLSF